MLHVTFLSGKTLDLETHADLGMVRALLALAIKAEGKIVKASHKTED